jgi:signal transduction histidine kinase
MGSERLRCRPFFAIGLETAVAHKLAPVGVEMDYLETLRNLRQALHELAQPMAAVTGLVDLLLLELDEESDIYREILTISEQLEKVLQIIGEMRRMAREPFAAGEPEQQALSD